MKKVNKVLLLLIGYVLLAIMGGIIIAGKQLHIFYCVLGPVALFLYGFKMAMVTFLVFSAIILPMLLAPIIYENIVTKVIFIIGIILWFLMGLSAIFIFAA